MNLVSQTTVSIFANLAITMWAKTGENLLSYDNASGSEIKPYNKIDKPIVVYRFSGNIMTSITMLHT